MRTAGCFLCWEASFICTANRYSSLRKNGGSQGFYFAWGMNVPVMLVMYGSVLILALRFSKSKIDLLDNPLTSWLSGISMEIYLSHMVVFRALEIILLDRIQGLTDGLIYTVIAVATLLGTVVFSFAAQKILARFSERVKIQKQTTGDVSNV